MSDSMPEPISTPDSETASSNPQIRVRVRSDSDIDIIESVFEIHIDSDSRFGDEEEGRREREEERREREEEQEREEHAHPTPDWAEAPSTNPLSTTEHMSTVMHSYNTIMADFQHNMLVYQQNVSGAMNTSRRAMVGSAATRQEVNEEMDALIYSYNTVMNDFQHNMLVYQRNVGSLITMPRRIASNRNQNQSHSRTRTMEISSSAVNTTAYSGAEGEICPISLETFVQGERVSTIRACNHTFRAEALAEWFSRDNHACPVCRHVVRIINPQTAAVRAAAHVMMALERASRAAGI